MKALHLEMLGSPAKFYLNFLSKKFIKILEPVPHRKQSSL